MIKQSPVVAFVHVPTLLYDQIFDLGAIPPFRSMPLGLMYLSATLKSQSNASEIFLIDYVIAASDMYEIMLEGKQDLNDYRKNPGRFIIETAQKAAKGRIPDIIAVSLNIATMKPFAFQIIEYLSSLWPDALVVFGGNYATNNVLYLLHHPDIDFVCRGEADWAFPQFINAFAQSREPAVKGFYSKNDIASGKPTSINCDYPANLDELPFPDWGLIDINAYQVGKVKRKRDFLTRNESRNFSILTTRGCPLQCTFCASHTVHGRKLRYRSTENILSEIRQAYTRYGATLFVPEDDMFITDKKRALALLSSIKSLGIPNVEMQFPSALSVNYLDEEIVDALCDAGMNIFYLAIESGSAYTQKYLIKKHVNLDRARRLVKYANERNLYTRTNFIIGFPNEKREHIQETIDFMKSLGADWYAIFVATPLMGSEMFNQFQAMGVLDFNIRNWENNFLGRGFDTKDFKAEELLEIAYRANLEVNFINNRQMRLGNWELALQVFTDTVNLHPYHIIAHYQILLCLENLGRHEDASNRLNHINHLVSTLHTSSEMLHKYGDLVPDLVERLHRCWGTNNKEAIKIAKDIKLT